MFLSCCFFFITSVVIMLQIFYSKNVGHPGCGGRDFKFVNKTLKQPLHHVYVHSKKPHLLVDLIGCIYLAYNFVSIRTYRINNCFVICTLTEKITLVMV